MKYFALYLMMIASAFGVINGRYNYIDTTALEAIAESNIVYISPPASTVTNANEIIEAAMGNDTVIYLMDGLYQITGDITMTGYSNLTIEGMGPQTIIKDVGTGDYSCIYQSGPGHDLVVRNVTVDNNNKVPSGGGSSPFGKCVFINGNPVTVVGSDLYTYRCRKAHTASSDNRPASGANWATYWYKCSTTTSAAETWVTGTAYTGIDSCYGIRLEGIIARNSNAEDICVDYAKDITIRNCRSYGAGWSGITVAWCEGANIYNNYIANCGNFNQNFMNYGISVLGTPYTNVSMNYIENCTEGGILVTVADTAYGSFDINVVNNMIIDNGSYGIYVACSTSNAYNSRVSIRDNHLKIPAGEHGINLTYLKNFVLEGNTVVMGTTNNSWVSSNTAPTTVLNGIIQNNMYTAGAVTNIPATSSGVVVARTETVVFTDVANAATNDVHAALDASVSVPAAAVTDLTQPDCPRGLVLTAVSHTNFTAMTILVDGIDHLGKPYNAFATFGGSTWSVETPPLSKINYVRIYSRTGTGAGDTISVSTSNTLGLGRVLHETGDVIKVTVNGANSTAYTVNAAGTITPTSIADNDDIVVYVKEPLNFPMI